MCDSGLSPPLRLPRTLMKQCKRKRGNDMVYLFRPSLGGWLGGQVSFARYPMIYRWNVIAIRSQDQTGYERCDGRLVMFQTRFEGVPPSIPRWEFAKAERWTLDSWRNRPAAQMPIYPEWESRTPGGHSRHRTPAWNSVTSPHSLWMTRATTPPRVVVKYA